MTQQCSISRGHFSLLGIILSLILIIVGGCATVQPTPTPPPVVEPPPSIVKPAPKPEPTISRPERERRSSEYVIITAIQADT